MNNTDAPALADDGRTTSKRTDFVVDSRDWSKRGRVHPPPGLL
jgi:hypothetical protein